jgi:hypothetical protein
MAGATCKIDAPSLPNDQKKGFAIFDKTEEAFKSFAESNAGTPKSAFVTSKIPLATPNAGRIAKAAGANAPSDLVKGQDIFDKTEAVVKRVAGFKNGTLFNVCVTPKIPTAAANAGTIAKAAGANDTNDAVKGKAILDKTEAVVKRTAGFKNGTEFNNFVTANIPAAATTAGATKTETVAIFAIDFANGNEIIDNTLEVIIKKAGFSNGRDFNILVTAKIPTAATIAGPVNIANEPNFANDLENGQDTLDRIDEVIISVIGSNIGTDFNILVTDKIPIAANIAGPVNIANEPNFANDLEKGKATLDKTIDVIINVTGFNGATLDNNLVTIIIPNAATTAGPVNIANEPNFFNDLAKGSDTFVKTIEVIFKVTGFNGATFDNNFVTIIIPEAAFTAEPVNIDNNPNFNNPLENIPDDIDID